MEPILTFTGIDYDTSIERLPKGVEYAVLYDGRDTESKIRLVKSLALNGHRIAIHLCSLSAIDMLIDGALERLVQHANRIQLNKTTDRRRVARVCDLFTDKTVITQHNRKTSHLLSLPRDNHALLVDSSSGRGILPREWSVSDTDKKVGFAGGLNAQNIVAEYEKIRAIAKDGFWLDIQRGVRDDNNRFSLKKVKEIWKICIDLIKA